MMRCKEARQLFDAYLDGELPPTLQAELGAHRIQCAECRTALALLEVSGQILASDRDDIVLGADFADRLLACMAAPRPRRLTQVKRALYYAAPLAAAALIVLAFLGVFDRANGTGGQRLQVAGQEDSNPNAGLAPAAELQVPDAPTRPEQRLERWIRQTQETGEAKRQSVESLQRVLDLTIGQWLDILEEAKDPSASEDHFPGADIAGKSGTNGKQPPVDTVDIVD